jgi:hypothetical protein
MRAAPNADPISCAFGGTKSPHALCSEDDVAAKEAAMSSATQTTSTPRGVYTGSPLCAPRGGRRFYQCPICGGWVDSSDPRQMAEHEGEAPAAPPVTDSPPAPPLAEAS